MGSDEVSDVIVHIALTTFCSIWNMELKDELSTGLGTELSFTPAL